MAQKKIKIYDRTHATLLDEIDEYSGLKYSWVLNGKGAAEFNMPLESARSTEVNFAFRNHVEIWDGAAAVWGGEIVALEFTDGKLKVSCYGYMSLLERRRLRYKAYSEKPYGDLFTELLADVNAVEATGVTIGNVEAGSLKTQRTVNNTEMVLDKLVKLAQDGGYDFEVDESRALNFYLKKGTDKSADHVLTFGGDADNIVKAPTLSRNILSLANSVYCEANNGTLITSTKEDGASHSLYGYQEGVLTGSDSVILQSTLDNNTAAELQRRDYPVNSINITAIDSALCSFSDLKVGDMVTVKLIPFWNYSEALRVLQMTHDESNGQREIVVGETLSIPAKPTKKIFKK